MKEKRYRIILIISVVAVLLMAIATESLYFSDFEYKFKTERFNKLLREKEKILDECLNNMIPILASGESHGSFSETNFFHIAEQNRITLLEYIDKKLIYWSDNEFDVPPVQNDFLFTQPLIFLQNGWFLNKTVEAGNEKIAGLLRIRTDFGFENEIVKNGFIEDFRIPESIGFSTDENASPYHVFNSGGKFLFALVFPENKENTFLIILPLLLYVALFILIFLLTMELVKILVNRGLNWLAILSCLVIFLLIYGFILMTGYPSVLLRVELFLPYTFSLNAFIPSLGHLFLLSILAVGLSYTFYRYYPFGDISQQGDGRCFLVLTILLSGSAGLISVFHNIFNALILNSNISLETYKILELSALSLIGFASLTLLIIVPLLVLLKIFQHCYRLKPPVIILSLLVSLAVFVPFYYNDPSTLFPLMAFYAVMVTSTWITVIKKMRIFNMSVLFSVIFGIYSLYFITMLSEKKTIESIKIQALSLSTENDPVAEHLLLDLWPELAADTLLSRMMGVDVFERTDLDNISTYLLDTYFGGYWGNFKFSMIPCGHDDPLRIGTEDKMVSNCFKFFDDRIKRNGHLLTGTQFYFLENQGGRSYYIGRIFFNKSEKVKNGLFIELYSDVNVYQPGYSELLLDKNYHGYARLKDYSFAKYINGDIVLKSGDFPYNKDDADYVSMEDDYRSFNSERYKHILYQNGNITVIISRPRLTSGDIIISFAYLFAFIFLFSNLFILIIKRPAIKSPGNLDFRQKLQMSIIGILLVSFVLIGVVIAYLTISQYREKHYENIKEKLNSVYIELDTKLSVEKQLTNDWSSSTYSSMDELLIKLSNIFNTDINLYDVNGFLLATSRPEIFYRDLTSRRMNYMALINLTSLTKSEYLQSEKVGRLEYISAYIPFYNTDGEVLAYLNLPYFRMQSILAREISNLIVAVINFTLLLIMITMAFAVIISGRLTSPLAMLGEGLSSVELGKKSEHLVYSGNDEIGELVKQYNRMVDEIQESANKLAYSEREYAWREMAKQIAHEIKNPLTPMKLNVQQLLKSWKDGEPGFEKRLENFTANQIEYIDNLSSIASAFSSFAKMPGINPTEVNLLEQIKTTLELFKNTDNVDFEVKWPHETKVFILADKEHLNGIFSNLFKNAIQSIPQERRGLIKVTLEVIGDRVTIAVSDNGSGVPDELRKKMFTPNFTTKSSGMGLGLSIVKRYVENASGRIWFESETDKGSVFYVEFPLKYTVEKI